MKIILATVILLCSQAADAAEVRLLLKNGVTRSGEMVEGNSRGVVLKFKNGRTRQFDAADIVSLKEKGSNKNILGEILNAPAPQAEAAAEPADAVPEPAALPPAAPAPVPVEPQAPAAAAKSDDSSEELPSTIVNVAGGWFNSSAKNFSLVYDNEFWPFPAYGAGAAFKLVRFSERKGLYGNIQYHVFSASGKTSPSTGSVPTKWEQSFLDVSARYYWRSSDDPIYFHDAYWVGAGLTSTSVTEKCAIFYPSPTISKSGSGLMLEWGMRTGGESLSMTIAVIFRSAQIQSNTGLGGTNPNVGGFAALVGLGFDL
jgi:hypothetical protein